MKTVHSLLFTILLLPLTAFASLEELLGPDLVDADGNKVELSTLDGKIIGLYFSAEWCPTCRAFTPELVKARNSIDDFEVVFVSGDRSPEAQQKYMEGYKMKWPAIPFDSEKRRTLGEQFGVSGIPSLIIIDDQGNLISKQGRRELSTNPHQAVRDWQKATKGE